MSQEIDKIDVAALAKRARKASYVIASADGGVKDATLKRMASLIRERAANLKEENEKDLAAAREKGLSGAMYDRLELTDSRIESMAAGLEEVVALPDPVGAVTRMWTRPNGLRVGKQRIPLGVIGIIYESRPNVTADAAGLCVKSGNAVVLRGGSEAFHSNLAIGALLGEALEENGLPADIVTVIPVTDRSAIGELLELEEDIDVIIPRGGEGLIRHVVENSRIPVIKHYKGVCHVFVDESADPDMAVEITYNAKVQRPGVCNAAETLLIHQDCADEILPLVAKSLADAGVELRGCERSREILGDACKQATDEDYYEEFLDLIIAIKVVTGIDEAIDHVAQYGSMHTEAIVTSDYGNSQRWIKEVNSSCVLVNASTRFADGGQLGLGAEIGISTTKLHAFGPMGLEELTTEKFIVFGEGQVRK